VGRILVRLRWGESKAEVRAGPDGRFRFELAEPARSGRLYVDPPRPWRWRVPKPFLAKRLTPPQLAGAEEIVCEVAESRRGTVSGIAVDSENGAPVPHLRFTIASRVSRTSRRWFEPVAIETDAEGHFHTSTEIVGGPVRVSPGPGEARPVEYDPDCLIPDGPGAEPWILAFRTGRTLALRLTGEVPSDPTTLKAWLLTPGKARAVVETKLRVHPDGRVWIRPPKPRVRAGGSGLLAVGDEAGLVLGIRELRWGAEPEVLVVHLEQTAAVELALDLERPEGSEGPFWAHLSALTLALEPSDRALVDGSYAWRSGRKRGLAPGGYSLRASTRVHTEVVQDFELEPGHVHSIRVNLQFARGARTVHGRARTESGAALPKFSVYAYLRDAPRKQWSAHYFTEVQMCGTGIDHFIGLEAGSVPEVGRFRFERVPAGPLIVRASTKGRACTATLTERPDGDLDLDVVVHDRADSPGIGFRVERAEGESSPGMLTVSTRAHDGGPGLPWIVYSGQILAREGVLASEFEWSVTANGRRPVYGTQHDFIPETAGRAFARVHLERGWGTRVLVRDLAGAPLAGLAILVDGELAGYTDADGMLELALDEAPVRIEVDAPGLRPIPAYPEVPRGTRSKGWHEIRLGQ